MFVRKIGTGAVAALGLLAVVASASAAPLFTANPDNNLAGASGIAAGNLGNGETDLAVVSSSGLNVFFGAGNGTFAASPVESVAAPGVGSPVLADVNGDTHSDVLFVDASNMHLVLNQGGGIFNASSFGFAGARNLAVADFNGDATPDLAIVSSTGNSVAIALGKGDGTFGSPHAFSVGAGPNGVAVGDFNGDGKVDVATINSGSNTLSVLLGTGTGTLGPSTNISVASPNDIKTASIGGKLYLVVATNNGILLFRSNGDGTFQPPTNIAPGVGARQIALAIINGNLDIIAADASTVDLFAGHGDGTFDPGVAISPSIAGGFQAVTVGAFDGTDLADVAAAGQDQGFLLLQSPIVATAVPEPGSLALLGTAIGVAWLRRRRTSK